MYEALLQKLQAEFLLAKNNLKEELEALNKKDQRNC